MTPRLSVRAIGQKAALHAMLRGNSRPQKAVADALDVSPQVLSQWADASIDSHIPSARLPGLLMASDDLSLTTYWASLQGAVVVELPTPHAHAATACQLSSLASEFAALLVHHAESTQDGVWTAEEVATLRPIAERLAALALAQLAYADQQVAR